MSIAVQTGMRVVINVTANGVPAGSLTVAEGAGSWQEYRVFNFDAPIPLNAGANIIELTFETYGVNIDYFVLVGEPQDQPITPPNSVRRPSASRSAGTGSVRMRPVAGGFTAALPTNHGYTSYTLIDLRGREIRRGEIGANMTNLRFDNVRSGVMFLRLNGRNGAAVMRTPAVR